MGKREALVWGVGDCGDGRALFVGNTCGVLFCGDYVMMEALWGRVGGGGDTCGMFLWGDSV